MRSAESNRQYAENKVELLKGKELGTTFLILGYFGYPSIKRK